ncbi:MAG: alanine racemase [Candidatus Sungbacteria bacterium]|nr:alanine racemase [bacterium]MDZ4260593.1 alanine racemase [Candidatus Sungbacteria bacterium]
MKSRSLRTWIEIDKKALRHNAEDFFRFIPQRTRLMAVVKSNAYGHGITHVAQELAAMPQFASKGWFGVDSIVEGLRLRREGITNPILVLGYTLPARLEDAVREKISISISNFDALAAIQSSSLRPAIHLKLDTGMHRQGFLERDIPKLVKQMSKHRIVPEGIFTHFASAKDLGYPTYTLMQLACFQKMVGQIKNAGFNDMMCHAAATGGTLLFPDAHLDMVRIGMGLYGYFPSSESRIQNNAPTCNPMPVLSWKTLIAEIKRIPKGSFVGYDLTERVYRPTRIAVLPIGYWHGYDRGLSSMSTVLVAGRRARVLGRVSMDMIVIDVTDIPDAHTGTEAVLIGKQGRETITAEELGRVIGTSAYEFLTRINPLIKRIVV